MICDIHLLMLYDVCSFFQDGSGLQSRWDLISSALKGGLKSSLDIRVGLVEICNYFNIGR